MPEAVEVVFQIDQPGTAEAKLKTLDQGVQKVGTSAQATGQKMDQAFGPRSFGQRAQDLDFERVLNRGDGAARKLAGSMKEISTHSAVSGHGLQNIKNALLGIAGVPHLQAVESLTQLGGTAATGPILVLAGVALGLMKIKEIFDGIRQEAEATLKATEKWSNLGRMGIRGGTEETKDDFERLRATQIEMKKLLALGMTSEAATVSEKMTGVKGLSLQGVEAQLALAKARADSLGIDTRDQSIVQKLKDQEELHKKQISDFNEFHQLQLTQQISEMDAAVKLREVVRSTTENLKQRSIDAFKANFGRAQTLGSLFDEGERLRAGLGGADTRARNADIDSQKRDLGKQIMEAMLSGREFGAGGRRDLLQQFGALGQTSIADRLAAESRERQIRLGQDALTGAGGDKLKQSFALDAILAATSNVGALTSEQIDARMKALEQQSSLQQDLKTEEAAKAQASEAATTAFRAEILKRLDARNEQGIKVTLKDDSGGVLKAEMDATPTPESSGVVPLNQTSAFRNDPLSGRL